jgi:hypothetical protein
VEPNPESSGASIVDVIGKLAQSIARDQAAVLCPQECRLMVHFLCYYMTMMKACLDNLETASDRLGSLRAVLADMMESFDASRPRNGSSGLDRPERGGPREQGAEEAPHSTSES